MFDKTCAVCGGGVCEPECAACRRLTELITEWEYGYEKGLDAAREAVLGARSLDVASGHMVDGQARFIWMNHALEAIDALKEKA